ncbi:Methyl-CpG DNA binding [Macleaya cordata]|uniref:Methyl-CpG DNA binding n=1 Tax=Macleaya cordata TaxID=56857 RepID=A0A200R9D0_MACCD|nr:Methyl-CpG DNA binding [Macleaya cordata]
MHSNPGDASPKVKEEQESHLGDDSFKVKEEQESHLGDAFPKASEEEEKHPGDAFPKVSEEEEKHPGDAFPTVTEEEEEHPGDASFQVKKEDEFPQSSSASPLGNTLHEPQDDLPADEEEDDDVQIIENGDDLSYANASNQLVLYDPGANCTGQIEPVPEPTEYQPPPFPSYAPNLPSRVLPSVGAFTVQCANCFKWRLIPTKEKYEEIRENILQQPFVCESAREWRPDISCDDPADINQDGSRLWAIDKPNIAQPPPGWQRLLRIRGEGSTKFADVYYAAPSGKRLRSMVEVQKYLLEHPEYLTAGVTMAQFSFQIPKPLQENYVRKRPARVAASCHGAGLSMSRPLEPTEVNPLSWAGPVDGTELEIADQGLSNSYFEAPLFQPAPSSAKKQRTKSTAKQMSGGNRAYNQPEIKVEEPPPSRNSPYGHL